MMMFEIAGIKKTIEINGSGDASHAISIAIKRWLHMAWLKENNITSKSEARESLKNINFDELKKRYGFKVLA